MPKVVLAIDDTVRILDIIKFFLEHEGYLVKTSTSPFEGIAIAKQGGIDLIILDIMMPGMDGYKACEILKGDEKTREIPVIMLTAKAIIMNTPKDFFYGLYGFLSKPFSKKDLLSMVGNIICMTRAPSLETRR